MLARWAHRHARWLFPAPAVLLVAAIIVYPIVYTGWMSLQEWFASSLTGPKFIGLSNYTKIGIGDARFREAVVRTLYFTLVAVAAETVLGVATIGRIARVRRRPRPQNSRLKRSTIATPRTVSAATATSVK